MKDKIKMWLTEEGIFKTEISDENADWHFLVEFPPNSKQMSNIIKLKGRDVILVASGIALSDKHYSSLHSLPEDKKKALIHRWKIDLLFRDVEFRMIPDIESVKQIEFQVPLYLEDLRKSDLMKALREVFKCKLYIVWDLDYEFEKKLE